jgi:hypothetical protein
MAPRDSSRQVSFFLIMNCSLFCSRMSDFITPSCRTHGIFRLTTPGGMSVIRQCQHRGFHPHDPPPDGGPIYKPCTDVYMNPNLKFDVIDLR